MQLFDGAQTYTVEIGGRFFPLSVDYEEKLYAAGRIPGSFFRREGRPSELAILTARLVDRPLRPLFPKGMRNEVQIIITALSSDSENLMDPLAITAASAALSISDVPWNGPIAGIAVGAVDGELVVNPTAVQMERSTLDLRIAGTADNILMVEAGANEIPEDTMLEALKLAHDSMQPLVALIAQMQSDLGKEKSSSYETFVPTEELQAKVAEIAQTQVETILSKDLDKHSRKDALDEVLVGVKEALAEPIEAGEVTEQYVGDAFSSLTKNAMRRRILDEGIRPDGRDTITIREISCQVGNLPRVHGTGLFMRGETHVLSIATLGTPGDAQRMDTLHPMETKRYIHHYNFPPYSTGEAYPMRGPKRREIGHGALAERALLPVIPSDYPYTLRVVSEAVSSNGSTSMGSVCGSTLALMDAGVPIESPVSGIAMGLIQDPDTGAYKILSDIQGLEDALGDMDFKVAGTEFGITALQMDLKIKGLDFSILEEALAQAYKGRMHIMEGMLQVLPEPRTEMSQYAPRILTTSIDPEKIGKLIGPGGSTIRGLQENHEVKIDVNEDGTVYITGEGTGAENALAEVDKMTEEVILGKIYTGPVVRVEAYGAFVNLLPGVDGLVHISQLADYRVGSVEEIAKMGEDLTAMVIDIDRMGKVRLSRQAVLEGWTMEEAQERDRADRNSRGGGRGGDRRGGGRRDDRRGGGGGGRW